MWDKCLSTSHGTEGSPAVSIIYGMNLKYKDPAISHILSISDFSFQDMGVSFKKSTSVIFKT